MEGSSTTESRSSHLAVGLSWPAPPKKCAAAIAHRQWPEERATARTVGPETIGSSDLPGDAKKNHQPSVLVQSVSSSSSSSSALPEAAITVHQPSASSVQFFFCFSRSSNYRPFTA